MQPRDSMLTTKGPADIDGVRTKKRTFSDDASSDAAASVPKKEKAWYFLADRDLDIGGGNIALKAWKWTKFTEWKLASKVRSIAKQKGVQFIVTQRPPKDVI